MTMSTPSPQLSREEELAIWLEQKKRKSNSRTPTFGSERRDCESVASTTSFDARSGSLGSASHRRRSKISIASHDTPSASKTPYGERQQEGSGPTRSLSAHVSCRRRQQIPRGNLSTDAVSSRRKQKSLVKEERKSLSILRPTSWSATGRYLENRPSSVRSTEWNEQENNGSLVNRIRSRAAIKKERDTDEMSKADSTPYRSPLLSRDANIEDLGNFSPKPSYYEAHGSEENVEPDRRIDHSFSLNFKDNLSPLSSASQAPSPASSISSFEIDKRDADLITDEETLEQVPSDSTMELGGSEKASRSGHDGLCQAEQDVNPLSSPASTLSFRQDPTSGAVVAVKGEPRQYTVLPKSATTASRTPYRDIELDRCDVTCERKKLESVGGGENLVADRERITDNASGPALDFQGIEDEDLDWEVDEAMASRLRRRRSSSFVLKHRPVALDHRNSISPDPAKSAFLPIEMRSSSESPEDSPPRAGLQACAMFASPLEESSQECHSEISETASYSQDSPKSMGSFNGSFISSYIDQNDESATMHCVFPSHTVLKVNDRSILESIPERHGDDSYTLRLEDRVTALSIANAKQEKKLYAVQKEYEERITPFRDLFDDMKKLRIENQVLKQENQVLKQEKSLTKKMVEDVKEQMIQCLQSAVSKNQELQKQLNAEKAKNQNLEQEEGMSKTTRCLACQEGGVQSIMY